MGGLAGVSWTSGGLTMPGPLFSGRVPEDPTRALAAKGAELVEQMQAIVDRARAMIVAGEVVPEGDPVGATPSAYSWEVDHGPPPDASAAVRLGTVEDFATGEGYSVFFHAALAKSEDAFRRVMARELGRELRIGRRPRPPRAGACPWPPSSCRQACSHSWSGSTRTRDRRPSRSWRGTTQITLSFREGSGQALGSP